MRSASILLALVVVLGFVSEAGAEKYDYIVTVAGSRFGFEDLTHYSRGEMLGQYSVMRVGPFGSHEVPFTATQGLVGFCLIGVAVIALLVVATVRWKRKSSAHK